MSTVIPSRCYWLVMCGFFAGVGLEILIRDRVHHPHQPPRMYGHSAVTELLDGSVRYRSVLLTAEDIGSSKNLYHQASSLSALLERSPIRQFPSILEQLDEQTLEPTRSILRGLLVTRWLERDPAAAVAYATSLGNARTTKGLDELLFKTWAIINPARAFETAGSLPNAVRALQCQLFVIEETTRVDPEEALELALRHSGFARASTLRRHLNVGTHSGFRPPVAHAIRCLANQNPQKALDHLHRLPESSKEEALQAIAVNFGRLEPEAGLHWIESLRSPDQRSKLLSKFHEGWFRKDREKAIDAMESFGSGKARDQLVANLLAWTADLSESHRSRLTALMSEEGQMNHRITIAAATGGREGAGMAMSADVETWRKGHIIAKWTAAEPERAWEWAFTLDDTHVESALSIVSEEIAAVDPIKAADLINLYADHSPSSLDRSVRHVAVSYTKIDPSAALNWASQLPEELGTPALASVARQWCWQNPDALRSEITDLPPGRARDALAKTFIGIWLDNPDETHLAAQWISSLEEPPISAVSRAYREWAEQDVTTASEVIRTLPDGTVYDASVTALVKNIAEDEPAMARRWAETIGDDDARSKLLHSLEQRANAAELDPFAPGY